MNTLKAQGKKMVSSEFSQNSHGSIFFPHNLINDKMYGIYKNLRNFSCRQLRKLLFVFATFSELHFKDCY